MANSEPISDLTKNTDKYGHSLASREPYASICRAVFRQIVSNVTEESVITPAISRDSPPLSQKSVQQLHHHPSTVTKMTIATLKLYQFASECQL
jgi:hypothetical protein